MVLHPVVLTLDLVMTLLEFLVVLDELLQSVIQVHELFVGFVEFLLQSLLLVSVLSHLVEPLLPSLLLVFFIIVSKG